MRINYVLVDFENVQPASLDALAQDHFQLMVFVGASQTKVPFELAASLQRLGPRAEYIKIAGNGANALDFHIAYTIGRLSATDPTAYFHIVSKDTGFDPLILYLKSKKVFADRVKAIDEIAQVKAANSKLPAERLDVVLLWLRQNTASRPRTVKTLSSTIASRFQKQLAEGEVAALVEELVVRGHIAVIGSKVSYAVPTGG